MKARIVITLEGEVSIVTAEGSFEEGQQKINEILAGLKAQGINLDLVGQVEQHRHDDPEHLTRHQALDHHHH